ncbi:hypothetical protein BH23ACT11_BH23ACT11_14610 [soil metagenome]
MRLILPWKSKSSERGSQLTRLKTVPSKYAQVSSARFHDLRHTCATLLLSRDVNPKVVSEMIGRSFISVTLGVNSHLLPDMQVKASEAFEEALK